jgi:hypothetical protein
MPLSHLDAILSFNIVFPVPKFEQCVSALQGAWPGPDRGVLQTEAAPHFAGQQRVSRGLLVIGHLLKLSDKGYIKLDITEA